MTPSLFLPFPLLGLGEKLYPELDGMFLSKADGEVPDLMPAAELKGVSQKVHEALWDAFSRWQPSDWLAKHTSVSDEDFAREPHRNRLAVVLSRNTHIAFHVGQAILTKPHAS